jgi:alpha-tubulin suppressor-like RCC1 family protein
LNFNLELMMKKIIAFLFLLCPLFLFGADFYWVNGSGNWSDTSHWATTSGGSSFHGRIPGPTDNVIFDAQSFSSTGQRVTADLNSISCKNMDWSNALNNPSFYNTASDSVNIYGNLTFGQNMMNDIYGSIIFRGTGTNLINTYGINIKNHCYIIADSCVLQSDLNIDKNLYFIDGSLFTNNHNISCYNMNPASNFENSVNLINPTLYGNDTLTITSSLFLNSSFRNLFTGIFVFEASTIDTNYINLGSAILRNDCYFEGNGLIILKDSFHTQKDIYFNIGKLKTNNHNITCRRFISNSSYARELDFGFSTLYVIGSGDAWDINPAFLTFDASNSELIFVNSRTDTVNFYPNSDLNYNVVNINVPRFFIKTDGNYDSLIIPQGSDVTIMQGTEQKANFFQATGNCANYVYLHRDESGATATINQISGSAVLNYVRLKDIIADGSATFNATNSLDEGNNEGWNISVPTASQDMFWIGGSGNWSDLNHWSYSSGGSKATCLPGPNNNVFFDANSFSGNDTVTIDRNAFCNSMNWSSIIKMPILAGDDKFLQINGSLMLNDSVNTEFSGDYVFNSASVDSICTDSSIIHGDVYFQNSGQFKFVDDFVSTKNIYLSNASLDLNAQTLICEQFISNDTTKRSLDISYANIVLNGNDTAWNVNPNYLTFNSDSSEINLGYQGQEEVIVKCGELNFNQLVLDNSYTYLMDCDTINSIFSTKGKVLKLGAANKLFIDSLTINSNCASPFTIRSADMLDDSACIYKIGYPNLTLNYITIDNVAADTSNGGIYTASQSIAKNNTEGWTISDSTIGTKYYWIGNSGNWSDTANWSLTSGGLNASCLPSINDTVIFDTNSFDTLAHKVIVDMEASVAAMNWDSAIYAPELHLISNLSVAGDMVLNDSMKITSENNSGIVFMPDTFAIINPNGIDTFGANLTVLTKNLEDSVILLDNLFLDPSKSLTIAKGTFNTNNKNISTGNFTVYTINSKNLYLTNSIIDVAIGWNILQSDVLNMNTGNSIINLNAENGIISFEGGNQYYHSVFARFYEDAQILVNGSNTFNKLVFEKGLSVILQDSSTQTINDTFIATGTCAEYINIQSSVEGSHANIQLGNSALSNMECMIVEDIKVLGNSSPYTLKYSQDEGNNVGLSFSSTPATTALFSVGYNQCFGDTFQFMNQSTAISGDSSDLRFTWYFDDGDTVSSAYDTSHYFDTKGKHYITLKSTYLNECFDLYEDSVFIKQTSVFLEVTEQDLEICQGDTVTFFVADNADSFKFYIDNVDATGFQSDTFFTTSNLQNGQTVKAQVMAGECMAESSNSISMTVNAVPAISMTSSDADGHICTGDTVVFTATGSDYYRFYLNGVAQGSFDTNSIFVAANLQDGDSISVDGKYAGNGCYSISSSSFVINVHNLPNVGISTTDNDQIICAGDTVGFNFTGAAKYSFYINDIQQGGFDTNSYLETTNIISNTGVYVIGQSIYGCEQKSSNIQFTANPVPNTKLSCSDNDRDICKGEVVNFSATGASVYEFFKDGISMGTPSSVNTINLNDLRNNQTISVKGYINSCYSNADSVYTIKVRPNVLMLSSDDDNIICEGDEVTLTASGDAVYQFFVDNQSVTNLSNDSVYTTSAFKDGEIISVKTTKSACLPNPIQFTVNPNPTNVSLLSSDIDNLICNGDEITFTAGGASTYEIFIDTSSQGQPSINTTYKLSNIANNDSVFAIGYTDKGCSKKSNNTYHFTVNPYPFVGLITSDADLTICEGDSVSFTASGADSFMFMMDDEVLQNYSSNSVFSNKQLQNGKEIFVIGKTKNCASTSNSKYKFRVYNIPNVELLRLSETDVCEDDTIRLLASGASKFEFFVDQNSHGTQTSNTINYIPKNASHIIKVRGESNGCSAYADSIYTFKTHQYPVMTFTSDDIDNEICYGEDIQFTGNGAETYEFFINGLSQGASSSTNFIPDLLEDGDKVSLTGYNASCATKANQVYTIKVHKMDIGFTKQSSSNLICESTPVTFKANGGDEYLFTIDGMDQGSFSAKDSFIANNLSDGQIVGLKVKSLTTGCDQESAISYRMNVLATPVITAQTSTNFCKGDSVLLSSNYNDGNIWFKDGNSLDLFDEEIVAKEAGNFSLNVERGGNGEVYGLGINSEGQLGNNTTIQSKEPVMAKDLSNIVQIDAGDAFNIALDNAGKVYTWGSNSNGQIGDATYTEKLTPVNVSSISNVKQVVAGSEHSMVLLEDSTLMAWGNNTDGQLGYGNNSVSNFPYSVKNLNEVIKIAAGYKHSLALKADGSVWAMGNNRFGQLGDGTILNRNLAVKINIPVNITDIACGKYHSLAIDENGNVWTWGNNADGQLGHGNNTASLLPKKIAGLSKIIAIEGGSKHSLALNTYGQVYSWGNNSLGQLGKEGIYESLVPVEIDLSANIAKIECGQDHNFALEADNTIWAWGHNNENKLGLPVGNIAKPQRVGNIYGVVEIAAGNNHSAFVVGGKVSCSSMPVAVSIEDYPDVVISF